jgi:hypothetical protein
MRTSGTGSDIMMMAVPLGVIVLFALVAAGGPTEFLKLAEHFLEAGASAASDFIASLL